jgi:hypothetical protein
MTSNLNEMRHPESQLPPLAVLQPGWGPPDFSGSGIANLMASIELGLAGGVAAPEPDCPPLNDLPPERVAGHRHVLLMVIDGLGEAMLDAGPPCPTFREHQSGVLSSVFPTTTATGITCFLTGHSPARHGLTGWHVYLESLDTVMAVLPGRPRGGGRSYADLPVTPRHLLGLDPLVERLGVRCACVSPTSIADSPFNRSLTGAASSYVYDDLPGFFRETQRAVWDSPGFTYAYWPELDRLGHLHGVGSAELHDHMLQLDAGFKGLLEGLSGSDTLVLLTADHGMVDAPLRLDLNEHPDVIACLRHPLCGEPRVAFAYVRPECRERFAALVDNRFSHCLNLVPSRHLLDAGWFGPGPAHPQLTGRVGDFALLMHDGWMVSDRLPDEALPRMVGVHGGLSEAERRVPLVSVHA